MANSISLAPAIHDQQAPQWAHGELNGVAAAPGLPDSVRDLISRHTKIFFEWREAQRAARAAEQAVTYANQVDRQNRAVGLARGQRTAKAQAPEATKDRDTALQHESDLSAALAVVEADIRANIAAHRDQWLSLIDDEDAQLRAECVRMADQIRDYFTRRAQLTKVRAQVADPYGRKVWSAFELGASAIQVDNVITGALDTVRVYSGSAAATPFFADDHEPVLG